MYVSRTHSEPQDHILQSHCHLLLLLQEWWYPGQPAGHRGDQSRAHTEGVLPPRGLGQARWTVQRHPAAAEQCPHGVTGIPEDSRRPGQVDGEDIAVPGGPRAGCCPGGPYHSTD